MIDILQRGEELPAEWARELFPPERREYELVYYGKEREEDILADTMAVPLQPVRTFGGNGQEWHNLLIFGDNLQAMKTLLAMKERGELVNADGTPGVRLVYIDPPFATRRDFSGSREQRAYQDKIVGAEFLEFLRKRLILIRELLADDGMLYLHLDEKRSHYAKVLLDEVFGESNYCNEIIWRNTNSHSKATTFGNIHQCIYVYGKTKNVRFHKLRRPPFKEYVRQNFDKSEDGSYHSKTDLTAEGIRTGESGKAWGGYSPSAKNRHWAVPSFVYDLLDEDISNLRLLQKLDYLKRKGMIYIPDKDGGQPRILRPLDDAVGNLLMDIWAYQPYTQGVYEGSKEGIDEDVSWAIGDFERTGYPTQKPEGLLARIVGSSSDPGDIVLDAFAGSGTTCAVAEKLHRRWIAIDCGKLAVYTIQKRMLNLTTDVGNRGQSLKPKPFTLYNAGLYDFSTLKQLPWASWRFFALQLFGCKDEPHVIGGLQLDGKRQGYSVLAFNHVEQAGKRIDEDTVADIHAAVGKKIGGRFFIIAPRGVFDFQQDYIDVEGVRYYALRIPYSIINELHRREFTALQQPNDEVAVNDSVDAVGFDFIQPPEVDFSVSTKKAKGQLFKEACLKIKKFKTHARLRGKDTPGGLEAFSMLMLDFDYNSDVFDLDAVFYANQMQADDWQARFAVVNLGENVMAVFIDIYGNELGVVIPREVFGVRPAKSGAGKGKTRV